MSVCAHGPTRPCPNVVRDSAQKNLNHSYQVSRDKNMSRLRCTQGQVLCRPQPGHGTTSLGIGRNTMTLCQTSFELGYSQGPRLASRSARRVPPSTRRRRSLALQKAEQEGAGAGWRRTLCLRPCVSVAAQLSSRGGKASRASQCASSVTLV